jgi:hypothetical protein
MRTEAQIAASRANDPISATGRAISAQNNTAHGLAGATLIVIEGESRDRWQDLLEVCHREFQAKIDLGAEIAVARWRLWRCWLNGNSPLRCGNRKTVQKPGILTRGLRDQYAAAPTKALEPPPRVRRNQKFPNEPKNSGE